MGRLAADRAYAQRIKAIEDENAKLQSRVSDYEQTLETLRTQKSNLEKKVQVTNELIASTDADARASQKKRDEGIIAELTSRLAAAESEKKKCIETESMRIQASFTRELRVHEASMADVKAQLKAYEAKEENLRKAHEAKLEELRGKLEHLNVRNAGSSTKGADYENEIAQLLHDSFGVLPGYKMLPHKIRSGDHVVKSDSMTLMFETKDKAKLTKAEDIDKAHRDMDEHKECHALVFISKVSEIPDHQKPGHFDISRTTDGRPMIWIGKFDEKPDKIAYMQMVHLVLLELLKLGRTLDKSSGESLASYKDKVITLRRYLNETNDDFGEIKAAMNEYKKVQKQQMEKMEGRVIAVIAKFQQRIQNAMQDDEEEVAPLPTTNSSASTPPVEVPTIVESSAPIISRPMPSLPHVVPTIIESSVPLGSSLSSSGFNAVKVSMMDTPLDYKKLCKAELKQLCKDRKIKGVTGKSKEEIIAMLS
jgi:hypothetical protein